MSNILLVEDDEIILDTYKTILEIEGYTVFDTPDPYKALQIIQKQEIQLAILDYNLPKMTGTQLGHLINKAQSSAEIIFISGHPQIHEIVKEVDYKVYKVFSKPINIEEFVHSIKARIDSKETLEVQDKQIKQVGIQRISKIISGINQNLPVIDIKLTIRT